MSWKFSSQQGQVKFCAEYLRKLPKQLLNY